MGFTLFSEEVQSTADHPNLNNGNPAYVGQTLPVGTYEGNMLEGSGSYLNPIQLINNSEGITINGNYLIHPNEYTKKDGGPWNQPYSLGCQIMKLDDFNVFTNILQSLGFQYSGQLSDREQNGSSITVVIK